MNNEELRTCLNLIADLWNNQVLPGTIAAWADELVRLNAIDVQRGLRSLVRTTELISLGRIMEHVSAARADRQRIESTERPRLAAANMPPLSDDQRELNRIRFGVICEWTLTRPGLPSEQVVTESLAEATQRFDRMRAERTKEAKR